MQVIFNQLPRTLSEFEAMPQLDLRNPENTCAMFLCALELYLLNRDEGVAALNLLRGPRPMSGYDIQFLRDRLRDKAYLPKAYFEGAVPQNGYTPYEPYVLHVLPDQQPAPEGYLKLFLRTAGADRPRPITLRRKGDGSWCLWEYSSILSGIRQPASADPWA